MPACKVGCCPDDICDCSNDCECLLPPDFATGVGFENPFVISGTDLKEIPDGSRLKICPCRTKEELADYVKPIEPSFDVDDTEEMSKGVNKDEIDPVAKQSPKDNCCQDVVCKNHSDDKNSTLASHDHTGESGRHAPLGHNDRCCDDASCAKTAVKDRGSMPNKAGQNCCDDESCQKDGDCHPPDDVKHRDLTPAKSCCKDKSCGGERKLEKESKECCDDKNCGDKNCGAEKADNHEHPKPSGSGCCNDKSCGAEKSGEAKHGRSSKASCCDDKSCGKTTPSEVTHKHSHPEDTCCGDKKCEKGSSSGEAHKNPRCCDDKSCKESCSEKKSKDHISHISEMIRTNSLPTNSSSNPNSPAKIARAPNFEIKPNFNFEVSPAPYRKTKRSQSLAEARLGSLLNERRPSCFQLSTQELRQGLRPDPHRGHDHHRRHEHHHDHHHRHDHHRHDHHHDHHDHHHDDDDHHDDDSQACKDSCCQGSPKHDSPNSCCEDPTCGDAPHTSHEELKPLMKSVSKVNIDEMVLRTTKLRVQNMCCPKEAQIVHEELKKFEGIENIRVNVIGRVVYVSHFAELVSPTTLMTTLNKRHLGVSIVDTGSQAEVEKGLPKTLKIRLVNLAVQSVLIGIALGGSFSSSPWYMWVSIVEICFGIVPILKKVYHAIRNREIDLNILITITVIGTLAIQEWIEGAAVVFVFTLAGFLQRYCFYRVQKTISSLMLSKPSNAVMACTGECIPIENVPIGSIIAVRQGELIPLDGIVVKGVASVDESSISGEATPVEKVFESPAYSGTVIQNGYLEIETTSSSTSSTISKISAMVEDAQMNVSLTEIMVNKFAKFYTPLVIVVAGLVFLIPLFLGLAGVEAYDGRAKTWGERALIVLVTACPCALLMATPTVVICGINGAARLGALIKGGTYLEALGQINLLAFDKTGTLTEGKFQVVDLVPADNYDESDVLRWAAALESKSSHPLAAAIVNEFTGECVSDFVAESDVLPDVFEFRTMEGQGISGKIEGHDIQVGNRSLLEKLGVSLTPKFETAYISFGTDAKTVIFVCVDGELALMISLADIIRWESRAALTWLQDLGIHLCMLTGDAKQTANAVQKELKLDSCVSDMKPDDKLNWITDVKEQEIRQRRFGCFKKKKTQVVGMVGDGVNDGPALAASDVGIAMAAGGSALAVEAAGVALMNNSVLKVPEIISLSRFCRRIILENIIMSVLLKLVFVIVALTGFVRVWMAVLADLVGLLAVILNGLRPLKWKHNRTKGKSAPPRASFRRKRPLVMFETVV
ncbi:cadmium/zinc-transporting ATPase HMA3-like isoform X2 [Dendronephthya gigantea]|uniref:cadmium/zinc-transporting ATPase HMA3-like isoform X2 n=1 Tax=Dendronephthya gigantea TaxID=151771 RepID=UPI00106B138F|nr:cadmium/zinc-transporting ATPase HMA3-like isoform X2 [Dendronephthya gigantea]